MSFVLFRLVDVYARWREAYLRKYPQKRLFPEYPEDPSTPDRAFITLGEKGKKMGGLVALVVVLLLLSSDS